mgnify:FL=1
MKLVDMRGLKLRPLRGPGSSPGVGILLIIFWSTLLLITPNLIQIPLNHPQAVTALFFSGWLAHILFIYLALFISFSLSLKGNL